MKSSTKAICVAASVLVAATVASVVLPKAIRNYRQAEEYDEAQWQFNDTMDRSRDKLEIILSKSVDADFDGFSVDYALTQYPELRSNEQVMAVLTDMKDSAKTWVEAQRRFPGTDFIRYRYHAPLFNDSFKGTISYDRDGNRHFYPSKTAAMIVHEGLP